MCGPRVEQEASPTSGWARPIKCVLHTKSIRNPSPQPILSVERSLAKSGVQIEVTQQDVRGITVKLFEESLVSGWQIGDVTPPRRQPERFVKRTLRQCAVIHGAVVVAIDFVASQTSTNSVRTGCRGH